MEQAKMDPVLEFRRDHRRIRGDLHGLCRAISDQEMSNARKILDHLGILTGPHFRYEEEHLYPALRTVMGDEVDHLLDEHDEAVEIVREAVDLLARESLSEAEIDAAVQSIASLLIHVSTCDGLAPLARKLSHEDLEWLAIRFQKTRTEGVPLLEWADTIRTSRRG